MEIVAKNSVLDESPEVRLERMAALAEDMLVRCRAHGASQAEVSLDEDRGLAVNVRMGEVETVERTRDRSLDVTVYFGRRKGAARTADFSGHGVEATVAQACAIAKFTEQDPAAGLAEPELMATEQPDFDLWHPWGLDAGAAIALGRECEAAGRETDARISNSEGAAVNTGESLSLYANSHGFVGRERDTHHSLSCSLIAGRGAGMHSDHWYTHALAPEDLESAAAVGRRAAERAVARLDPRPAKTGESRVLYTAEVARSLIGHLLSAVSGGALYRKASFLLDHAGQRIFPAWLDIVERPHLRRGLRSAAFDDDGVATGESPLVEHGVLARYVLGAYSARKLGLPGTANAGGVHNLQVTSSGESFDDLVQGMRRGLIVTELMGQGVNAITGDYSRGAAGFWVEDGAIAHPVDEVTVAGNLKAMFAAIEAVGRDFDPRSYIHTGSILVGRMTVAGAG